MTPPASLSKTDAITFSPTQQVANLVSTENESLITAVSGVASSFSLPAAQGVVFTPSQELLSLQANEESALFSAGTVGAAPSMSTDPMTAVLYSETGATTALPGA